MKTLNKLLIAVGAAGLTSTMFVLYKLMTASEGEWIIYIDVDVVNQHVFFTIWKFSICFASCILIITNMKYFKNLNDQTVTPFDFFNMSQLTAKHWCL